jgi:hypothetical protein
VNNQKGNVDESKVNILERSALTYFTPEERNALKKGDEIQQFMVAQLKGKK